MCIRDRVQAAEGPAGLISTALDRSALMPGCCARACRRRRPVATAAVPAYRAASRRAALR
eukprot:15132224-Alexandrium_andersonii.AAC.1